MPKTEVTRLFGVPGAEHLYSTIIEAYEYQVDGRSDLEAGEAIEIEEWTVADNRKFFPTVDQVVDDVLEHTAQQEVTEDWYDAIANAVGEDVRVLLTVALDRWAASIQYRMAEDHVASHWATLEDDKVLVNGRPLYQSLDLDIGLETHTQAAPNDR